MAIIMASMAIIREYLMGHTGNDKGHTLPIIRAILANTKWQQS